MTYELKFNDQEMRLLNLAIGELPHKLAVPLITSINAQIADQHQGTPEADPHQATESRHGAKQK